jgi:phospholipid-translocating ATPase
MRVADFPKITTNKSFLTNILMCATSEDENVVYIEEELGWGDESQVAPCRACAHSFTTSHRKLNTFRVDRNRPEHNVYKLSSTVTRNPL